MTFKEELSIKANDLASSIDIREHIAFIKNSMKEYVNDRNYTVSLIAPKTSNFATGHLSKNHVDFFIPKYVSPLHYRKLFVDEFYKLGFSEDCMELDISGCKYYDSYNIKLRW